MKKKQILFRVVILVVILGAFAAAGKMLVNKKKASLAKSPVFHLKATPTQTAVAYIGNLEETRKYPATIEPLQISTISSRVVARIEKVHYDESDIVKAGAVLVSLDDRQFRDSLAAVNAMIEQTKADLAANKATVSSLEESLAYWTRESERDRALADSSTIPWSQAEAGAEKVNQTRGALLANRRKSESIIQKIKSLRRKADEARTIISYCKIKSPFNGVIASRPVDPGDMAAIGKILLTVENREALQLTFDVPQTDLPNLRKGLTVAFQVGKDVRHAAITRLYPSLNRARMLRAEALLKGARNGELIPGSYVNAWVTLEHHSDVTIIPAKAIIENSADRSKKVFVVKNGVLKSRAVKLLGTVGAKSAVQGVSEGEEVALSSFMGWAKLSDGAKVEATR